MLKKRRATSLSQVSKKPKRSGSSLCCKGAQDVGASIPANKDADKGRLIVECGLRSGEESEERVQDDRLAVRFPIIEPLSFDGENSVPFRVLSLSKGCAESLVYRAGTEDEKERAYDPQMVCIGQPPEKELTLRGVTSDAERSGTESTTNQISQKKTENAPQTLPRKASPLSREGKEMETFAEERTEDDGDGEMFLEMSLLWAPASARRVLSLPMGLPPHKCAVYLSLREGISDTYQANEETRACPVAAALPVDLGNISFEGCRSAILASFLSPVRLSEGFPDLMCYCKRAREQGPGFSAFARRGRDGVEGEGKTTKSDTLAASFETSVRLSVKSIAVLGCSLIDAKREMRVDETDDDKKGGGGSRSGLRLEAHTENPKTIQGEKEIGLKRLSVLLAIADCRGLTVSEIFEILPHSFALLRVAKGVGVESTDRSVSVDKDQSNVRDRQERMEATCLLCLQPLTGSKRSIEKKWGGAEAAERLVTARFRSFTKGLKERIADGEVHCASSLGLLPSLLVVGVSRGGVVGLYSLVRKELQIFSVAAGRGVQLGVFRCVSYPDCLPAVLLKCRHGGGVKIRMGVCSFEDRVGSVGLSLSEHVWHQHWGQHSEVSQVPVGSASSASAAFPSGCLPMSSKGGGIFPFSSDVRSHSHRYPHKTEEEKSEEMSAKGQAFVIRFPSTGFDAKLQAFRNLEGLLLLCGGVEKECVIVRRREVKVPVILNDDGDDTAVVVWRNVFQWYVVEPEESAFLVVFKRSHRYRLQSLRDHARGAGVTLSSGGCRRLIVGREMWGRPGEVEHAFSSLLHCRILFCDLPQDVIVEMPPPDIRSCVQWAHSTRRRPSRLGVQTARLSNGWWADEGLDTMVRQWTQVPPILPSGPIRTLPGGQNPAADAHSPHEAGEADADGEFGGEAEGNGDAIHSFSDDPTEEDAPPLPEQFFGQPDHSAAAAAALAPVGDVVPGGVSILEFRWQRVHFLVQCVELLRMRVEVLFRALALLEYMFPLRIAEAQATGRLTDVFIHLAALTLAVKLEGGADKPDAGLLVKSVTGKTVDRKSVWELEKQMLEDLGCACIYAPTAVDFLQCVLVRVERPHAERIREVSLALSLVAASTYDLACVPPFKTAGGAVLLAMVVLAPEIEEKMDSVTHTVAMFLEDVREWVSPLEAYTVAWVLWKIWTSSFPPSPDSAEGVSVLEQRGSPVLQSFVEGIWTGRVPEHSEGCVEALEAPRVLFPINAASNPNAVRPPSERSLRRVFLHAIPVAVRMGAWRDAASRNGDIPPTVQFGHWGADPDMFSLIQALHVPPTE